MSNLLSSSQPSRPPMQWSSLIQLVFSILAAVSLLGVASIIILINILQLFNPASARTDPTQSFMVAASLAFAGVLMLPSAWYSWQSLAHPESELVQKPPRRGFGLILTIIVLVVVPGALLLGNWAAGNNHLSWILLPPLNIIASALPALWLVYIGTRGLPLGSAKRRWGVFASGMVLGPLIIIILEFISFVGVGILAILWVTLDPSLSGQMNTLILRLQNSSSNPDAILRTLLPLMLNPGILFILFAFLSVIVPLIEEALKPLGVWFLVGKKLTPVHGFVYGVLSGAGFGLFENLGNTSNGGTEWAVLASARISTLLLHSFTAGLVGWALVSAWTQRRFIRLGISFLGAVLVHGLWNGMAVLSLASALQGQVNVSIPTSLVQISALTSDGVPILGALVLVLYIGFNAVLRRELAASAPAPTHDDQTPIPPGNGTLVPPLGESAPIIPEPNPPPPSQQDEVSQAKENTPLDQPSEGNPSSEESPS